MDYIVKQTVGKLLEGGTPEKASKLKILDPACGSGSFLLGAYQHILDWHRHWYAANEPEKHAKGRPPRVYSGPSGWRLTTAERRRILLNNIYGVDIDPQAVEVTKLSLLLKVLEEESGETLGRNWEMFHERALPDLDGNIKCGNSLIEPDFFEGRLDLDESERGRINAFDWDGEFPEILKRKGAASARGFDAVIGNPPYVRPHNIAPIEKEYFWKHYRTFTHKSDLYCCFIERSLSIIRRGGFFGYIVSHGWLRLNSFQELRKHLLDSAKIVQLVELPFRVFAKASVTTGIFVLEKGVAPEGHRIEIVLGDPSGGTAAFQVGKAIPQTTFLKTFQNVFDLSISAETESIKDRMRKGPTMSDHFVICFGLKTGDDAKFLHSTRGLHKEDRPLIRGEDIKRYATHFKGEYVWYVPHKMREHRATARPGDPHRFEQPKVLVKDTSSDFGCTYDDANYYVKDALIVIPKGGGGFPVDLRFVTGILNSRLMYFYYRTTFKTLHVQNEELASLPLPRVHLESDSFRAKHDKLVKLVERMLDLTMRFHAGKTPHDKTAIERQIMTNDRQIDGLVYELYGLTEDEIKIVEESVASR